MAESRAAGYLTRGVKACGVSGLKSPFIQSLLRSNAIKVRIPLDAARTVLMDILKSAEAGYQFVGEIRTLLMKGYIFALQDGDLSLVLFKLPFSRPALAIQGVRAESEQFADSILTGFEQACIMRYAQGQLLRQ